VTWVPKSTEEYRRVIIRPRVNYGKLYGTS
jgi:hypothetical protein